MPLDGTLPTLGWGKRQIQTQTQIQIILLIQILGEDATGRHTTNTTMLGEKTNSNTDTDTNTNNFTDTNTVM